MSDAPFSCRHCSATFPRTVSGFYASAIHTASQHPLTFAEIQSLEDDRVSLVVANKAANARLFHFTERGNMVNRERYFDISSFLKAEDVKDGASFVIDTFDEIKTRISDKPRPVLRLKGVDKPLGLNATNFDTMVRKYGDNEKKWPGKKIRLQKVRVNNPQTNNMQDGLRIV